MSGLTPPIRRENEKEITDSNRLDPVADRRGARPFILWREVLVAYLAPCADGGCGRSRIRPIGPHDGGIYVHRGHVGSGGVADRLLAAASRESRPWTTALPRIMVAAILAVGAAVIAGLVGWFASRWLPAHTSVVDTAWLARLQLDLPISAAVAAVIVSWRWRRQNP